VDIAFVGRGAVHRERAERAVASLLEQPGGGDEVGAAAAVFCRCLRSEDLGSARQVLQADA
jgi:hypothetical protein